MSAEGKAAGFLGKGAANLVGAFVGGLRPHSLLYMVGLLLIFLGERVIGGDDVMRWVLDGIGAVQLALVFVLAARDLAAAQDDQKGPHRLLLGYASLGILALLLYVVTTGTVVDAIGFSDEVTEGRYKVVLTALWPIVLLASLMPLLAVDRAIGASPVLLIARRVKEAATGGLAAALAIAMLFPLNYLASQHNERWDLGYFKTAQAGTATQALVANLSEPITAYLFFPAGSDVTQEVRTYFDTLKGPNLDVQYVDHAVEPDLAKELKVRDNGYVVLVKQPEPEDGAEDEGEPLVLDEDEAADEDKKDEDKPEPQVEKVKVGSDFDSAKRTLKKLDQEIQTALIKLVRGKRTAYFTVGHGELYWKASEGKSFRINSLKKSLRDSNFKVKELGLAQGLANEVPEDANLVFVLGPTAPLMPEEIDALNSYRKRGGSLLVALEPGGDAVDGLLAPLGLAYKPVRLVNDKAFLPSTRRLTDRLNTFSNDFSTHESVTTLSRNNSQMAMITPESGYLEETKTGDGKVTVTVRSLPDTWADSETNLQFDEDKGEARKAWPLAAAVEGPAANADAADGQFRAVVVADATWASDALLDQVNEYTLGNHQFLRDSVAWLNSEEESSGTTNSEEDVKIQHTREGQGWIFYGTTFLIPLVLLFAGLGRVRSRRKGGEK